MSNKFNRVITTAAAGLAVTVATLPPAGAALEVEVQSAEMVTAHASRSATTVGRGENSAISPDGRTVVYQAGHVMGKRNPETSPGRLMMWKAGRVRELLEAKTDRREYDPFGMMYVTNGGRHVVFKSWATTLTKQKLKPWPRCYVWTRATRNVKLLANGRPCFPVDLTADGQLYYEATSPGTGYRLRVVDITSPTRGTLVNLPDGGYTGSLKMSLDGRWYAYEKNGSLSTADMATRTTTAIETTAAYVSAFEVSPSGRFVAYIDNPLTELPDGDEYQEPVLKLWDRTTGAATELDRGTRYESLNVVGVSDAGRVAYTYQAEAGSTVVQIRIWETVSGPTTVMAQGEYGAKPDAAATRVLVQDDSTRKHFSGQTPDGLSGWSESTNPRLVILSLP